MNDRAVWLAKVNLIFEMKLRIHGNFDEDQENSGFPLESCRILLLEIPDWKTVEAWEELTQNESLKKEALDYFGALLDETVLDFHVLESTELNEEERKKSGLSKQQRIYQLILRLTLSDQRKIICAFVGQLPLSVMH